MYMIEISENKLDDMIDCIAKSIKHLSKVAETFEDLKDDRYYGDDDTDDAESEYISPKTRTMAARPKNKRTTRSSRYMGY